MKKLIGVLSFIFAIILSSNPTYASPVLLQQTVKQDQFYEIRSSDSIEVEVQNVEKVIENKVDLTRFGKNGWTIGFYEQEDGESRTCVFCWIFAIGYAIWLYIYSKRYQAKKGRKKDHWLKLPIIVGVGLYVSHAALHPYFASPIFLEYYWMILFDETIVFFILFDYLYRKNKKRAHSTSKQRVLKA